jgi:hypothetical protein
MKFFIYTYISLNDKDELSINAVHFIKNYLIGDILGSLIVLFFAALVVVPGIRYLAPHLIPKEDKLR